MFVYVCLSNEPGVRDAVHDESHHCARCDRTSADPKYNGLQIAINTTNVDIYRPEAVLMRPTVIPMLGRNVTLHGRAFANLKYVVMLLLFLFNSCDLHLCLSLLSLLLVFQSCSYCTSHLIFFNNFGHLDDFLPGVRVWVAGVEIRNITWVDTETLKFNSPPLNVSLYQNVSFVSPDGGFGLSVDAAFYTDDCPFEGLLFLSVFVWICVYVCVLCVCVYVYVYVCMCVYMCMCVSMCACVHMCVCRCIRILSHHPICLSLCTYVCV